MAIKTYSLFYLLFAFNIYLQTLPVYAERANNQAEQKDVAPFCWLLLIVGGCIVAVLLYVSWKKYREENKKNRTKKNDTGDDD